MKMNEIIIKIQGTIMITVALLMIVGGLMKV